MGEARRKKIALIEQWLTCSCGGNHRFTADWYLDRQTHIKALIVEKDQKFYVVKGSITRTTMKHEVTGVKTWIWIRKCMQCKTGHHLSFYQIPYERLAGYWTEEVQDGRDTTRVSKEA